MSALTTLKASGWKASPLSSTWSKPSEPAAPISTKPLTPAAQAAQPSESFAKAQKSADLAGLQVENTRETPVGKVASQYHWDGGKQMDIAADGRIFTTNGQEDPSAAHWDSGDAPVKTTGYSLKDPEPKAGKDFGLSTDKKVYRVEDFDAEGKSKGYRYELADERGLLSGFIADFMKTPIAGPLLGMAGAALSPAISSATGLGSAASNVVSSGLIGGVTGAATGAGFGKGLAMGTAGGLINAYNPAAQLGVGESLQQPINSAIKAGTNAAIRGDSVKDAVTGAALNPINLLQASGWRERQA